MTAVVTFAQLVEEEPALIARMRKAELWARWAHDDPDAPSFPPAPVAEFIALHTGVLEQERLRVVDARRRQAEAWERARAAGGSRVVPNSDEATTGGSELHLGVEAAIREPRVHELVVERGGWIELGPDLHSGTVVGATRGTRRSTWSGNPFLLYARPRVDDGELVQANLVLDPHYLEAGAVHRHPEAQLRPLLGVITWMRRRTDHQVPIVGMRYTTRATAAVAAACAAGLRVRAG